MAEAARRAGIPVLYYIAPQLWAWRPQRAKRLAAACDRLAVILPFEEAFFRNVGVQAEYVGHPLLDRGRTAVARRGARVARHSGGTSACSPSFPAAAPARSGGSGRSSAMPRATLLDRGTATRVIVAATDQGDLSRQ